MELMEYFEVILFFVAIALISAIFATNIIDGVKKALAIENSWLNRIITFLIDIIMSYWFYFKIFEQKDYVTYAIVLLFTYSGAEAIYNALWQLKEGRQKYDELINIGESKQL